MACFVPCKNGDDSSLPSLRSILATKQHGLPPLKPRKIKEPRFCIVSPNVLRARSKLLRSVNFSVAKARARALPGLTVRTGKEEEEKGTVYSDKHTDDEDIDDDRHGCIPKILSRQSSARFVVPVSHSGPIRDCSEKLSSTPVLFPLPLPPGHTSSASSLSYSSTASASTADAHLQSSDDQPVSGPLPLPCPANDAAAALREFSLGELAAGCENFSDRHKLRDGAAGPVYKASLMFRSDDVKETEATIARATLCISRKRWRARVQSLARLAHPNLCKIIGFCHEGTHLLETQQSLKQPVRRNVFLVFESAANGGLVELIEGEDQPPMDWSSRMKIAIGAAEGLAFLHERGLKQIVYSCFKTNCIQIDANTNAKLCEYGLGEHRGSCSEDAKTKTPVEINGEASEKGHVRGFGWLLVQLFFGGSTNANSDGKPLNLVVDTCMKGSFSTKAAKIVSDVAAMCLGAHPILRPSMRHVAFLLRAVESHPDHLNSYYIQRHRKRRSLSIG